MTLFLAEYRNIFIFLICSFVLSIVLLIAVYLLSFDSKVDLKSLRLTNAVSNPSQRPVILLKSIRCYRYPLFAV